MEVSLSRKPTTSRRFSLQVTSDISFILGFDTRYPQKATDKTKAPLSRAGLGFKSRANLLAAFSTHPPFPRRRELPSSLPESPPQALRWSALTTRSSQRSGGQ